MYLTAFWGHKTPCSGANLKRSQAFYAGITDILKLRVLLSFLNEDPKTCTVTGLAGVLGEGKQKVSRIFMALEREGLLDRSNPRRPMLVGSVLSWVVFAALVALAVRVSAWFCIPAVLVCIYAAMCTCLGISYTVLIRTLRGECEDPVR